MNKKYTIIMSSGLKIYVDSDTAEQLRKAATSSYFYMVQGTLSSQFESKREINLNMANVMAIVQE